MAIKCDTCGVESKVEEAFYRISSSYTSRVTRRCPKCWLKLQTAAYRRLFIVYFGMVLFGIVLLLFDAENGFAWFLLNLICYYFCMVVAAVPHEFGHALVGKAVGVRIFQVVIGFGRVIYEVPVCGFRFQLKSVPLGGFALGIPKDTTQFRAKYLLFTLAGPLANVFVACALVLAMQSAALNFDFASGLRPVSVFLIANLMCFAYSLWPKTVKTEQGDVPNDGQLLWKILFLRDDEIKEQPAYYYIYEGAECTRRNEIRRALEWFEKGMEIFPNNLDLESARGGALLYLKEFPKARKVFLSLIDKPDIGAYSRGHLANSIAWTDVLIGDPDLLEEADRYSKEAIESMPFAWYIRGTRGCVLVEMKQFEEGLKLLKGAMAESADPKSKALDACHIAIGEARRGNLEESRKYAEQARSLDSNCMLLDRLPKDKSTVEAAK